MRVDDIISELRALYKDGVHYRDVEHHLDEADVERWMIIFGCSRSQLFDGIAMRLASGFHRFELSFEFCDAVVNDLSGPVSNTSGPTPSVFWQVYWAFDEGEYYHGNDRDKDPAEIYTRPMIARVLETAWEIESPTLRLESD
jgi:hypothetical protein